MAKHYQVKAAMVVLRDKGDYDRYLKRGALVRVDVDKARLEQLVSEGLLEVVDIDDEPADADDDGPVTFDAPPPKNAARGTWERYARFVGLTDEEISGLKKPELVEAALAKADESAGDPDGDAGDGDEGDQGDGDADPADPDASTD